MSGLDASTRVCEERGRESCARYPVPGRTSNVHTDLKNARAATGRALIARTGLSAHYFAICASVHPSLPTLAQLLQALHTCVSTAWPITQRRSDYLTAAPRHQPELQADQGL